MCNLYGSTKEEGIRKHWRPANAVAWDGGIVAPRKPGPFLRRARHDAGYSQELVVGRWGLIPWFSKTADIKYATNNARSEELAVKASYKHPWARGQRCIIPADWFDEPNWETGKNEWWRFRRADGAPWGLAGLWNVWTVGRTQVDGVVAQQRGHAEHGLRPGAEQRAVFVAHSHHQPAQCAVAAHCSAQSLFNFSGSKFSTLSRSR